MCKNHRKKKNLNKNPKAPIVISNHDHKSDTDRILLYQTYEELECEEKQKLINSVHSAWDVLYDVCDQKKKLQEQLDKTNELMNKYKEKFGELTEDEEINNETQPTEKTNTNNTGAWFVTSAIITAAAILGGAYYLKR